MDRSFRSRTVALVVASMAAMSATAQTPAADEVLDRIEVTGIKDPAILPYKRAYELASKVRDASEGRVELQVRITSSATDQPIPDLDIAVVGSQTHAKAQISPEGFFTIPLNDAAYADGADFIVNQKKGAVRMRVYLEPRLSSTALTYEDIVETVRLARAARADILPWYLRIVTPTVSGIGLCFAAAGESILIDDAAPSRRAADQDETDDAGGKVHCAKFTARESDLARTAKLRSERPFKAIFIESVL